MTAIETLGFVPLDQIQDVFITEVKRIGEHMAINGIPRHDKDVYEYIEEIRLRLMQRCQFNIKSYLQQHPEVKQELRDQREAADKKSSKKDWKDRVAENRMKAAQYGG